MAVKFNWTCPYCNRNTTITDSNFSYDTHYFNCGNKDGNLGLRTIVTTCPNNECSEYKVTGLLYKAVWKNGNEITGEPIMQWSMKPSSF